MSGCDRHAEFERLQAIVDTEAYQDLLRQRYKIEEEMNELYGQAYELRLVWAGVMDALSAMHEGATTAV